MGRAVGAKTCQGVKADGQASPKQYGPRFQRPRMQEAEERSHPSHPATPPSAGGLTPAIDAIRERCRCRGAPRAVSAQLVRQRTALPHGVPGAGDTNEDSSANRIPHCKAVLVWAHVKHGHVDPGRLFDELQKITQRLHPEMVILTEPRSGRAALGLGGQRWPRVSSLPGSLGRPDSRPAQGSAAALRACRPCLRGS